MPNEAEHTICSLCERSVPTRLITLHHLMPRQKGGKAEDRTPLCKPCHNQLHAVFSNNELAKGFASIELLKQASQLETFLKWIRNQREDRNFRIVMSNRHPTKRRRR